jgi:hypothetical protein
MGYPFSRPFPKPIAETFLALGNAAGGAHDPPELTGPAPGMVAGSPRADSWVSAANPGGQVGGASGCALATLVTTRSNTGSASWPLCPRIGERG